MATNAIPAPELSASTAKGAYESYPPVTLKQRFEKLREVFEEHEEYLGVTPD